MAIGEPAQLAVYRFRFDGVIAIEGPNYRGVRGRVEASRGGERVALLYPEKRRYFSQPAPMTEAAIESRPSRDLYVALDEPLAGGAWTLRLQVKPFIAWIWGGCLLMALGGALSVSDRRYRIGERATAPAAANLAVLRHQLEELAPDAHYAEGRLDIERRALEEGAEAPAAPPVARRRAIFAAVG